MSTEQFSHTTGKRRSAIALLLALFCLGVMSMGSYFMWKNYDFLYAPPETPGKDINFLIPHGSLFSETAQQLQARGLVKDAQMFLGLAEAKGLTSKIQAGEFLLNTGWLPQRILKEISSGPGLMHRFTVREGLTWWQIADLVQEAGLGNAHEFSQAVHDKHLLAQYSIPAETAEGYLFPETYMFTKARELNTRQIVEMMMREFFQQAKNVFGSELPKPEILHRYVTLASIVEKETGHPSERFRIAGVYANRLKKPMRLQADPTTIYGLGSHFDGNLTHKNLADKNNIYNTYQQDGLPPGDGCVSLGQAAWGRRLLQLQSE